MMERPSCEHDNAEEKKAVSPNNTSKDPNPSHVHDPDPKAGVIANSNANNTVDVDLNEKTTNGAEEKNKSSAGVLKAKKSVRWSQELVMESPVPRDYDHGSRYVNYPSAPSDNSSSFNFRDTIGSVKDVLGRWGKKVGETTRKAEDLVENTWQHSEMVTSTEAQLAARVQAQEERRQRRAAATSRGEAKPSRPAQTKRRRVAARRPSSPETRRVPAAPVHTTVVVVDPNSSMPNVDDQPAVTVAIPRVDSPSRAPEHSSTSLFQHNPIDFSMTLGRKVSLPGDQDLLRSWNKRQIETQLHQCGLQTIALSTYIGKTFSHYEETIESSMQQLREHEEALRKMTSEMDCMRLSHEKNLRWEREQAEKKQHDLQARFNREINQISSEYLNRGREEGRRSFLQSSEFQEMQQKAVHDFQASSQFQDIVLDKSAKVFRIGFFRCQAQCMLHPDFSGHTDWSFLDASRRVDLEGVTCDDEDSIVDITEDLEPLDDATGGAEAAEDS